MKRAQRLILVTLNQASIGASEAIHEVVYNKTSEAIIFAERSRGHLLQAIAYLKGLKKSQEQGG